MIINTSVLEQLCHPWKFSSAGLTAYVDPGMSWWPPGCLDVERTSPYALGQGQSTHCPYRLTWILASHTKKHPLYFTPPGMVSFLPALPWATRDQLEAEEAFTRVQRSYGICLKLRLPPGYSNFLSFTIFTISLMSTSLQSSWGWRTLRWTYSRAKWLSIWDSNSPSVCLSVFHYILFSCHLSFFVQEFSCSRNFQKTF